jgi:hypothetical protein
MGWSVNINFDFIIDELRQRWDAVRNRSRGFKPREWIKNNPKPALWGAGICAAIFLVTATVAAFSGPDVMPQSKIWKWDEQKGRPYRNYASDPNPNAVVYARGDSRDVAYVERQDPETRKQFVKRPGEDEWTDKFSDRGRQIVEESTKELRDLGFQRVP